MTDSRQRAFLELLEPVYDRLSRYALAVTHHEMDAEDLVSTAVLQAYERFDETAEHDRFLHYLITIASRLHKRRRYRERRRVAFSEPLSIARPDTTPSPETAAEIRLIMDALNTLPAKMRETIVLFDISDFSLEEIRRVQGGTVSGVKSRLKRGRERLARKLGVRPPVLQDEAKPRQIIQSAETDMPFLLLAQENYGQ